MTIVVNATDWGEVLEERLLAGAGHDNIEEAIDQLTYQAIGHVISAFERIFGECPKYQQSPIGTISESGENLVFTFPFVKNVRSAVHRIDKETGILFSGSGHDRGSFTANVPLKTISKKEKVSIEKQKHRAYVPPELDHFALKGDGSFYMD